MTALQPVSFMAGNFGMCVSCPGLRRKGHQGVPEVPKRVEVALEDGAGQREPRRNSPWHILPQSLLTEEGRSAALQPSLLPGSYLAA